MPRPTKVPTFLTYIGPGGARYARTIVRGRCVYLGKADSPEAIEKFQRVIAQYRAGQVSTAGRSKPPEDMSVTEVAADYVDYCEDRYRDSRRQLDIIKSAVKVTVELFGSTPARDFGPRDLKAIRQRFVDGGKLCRAEVNRRTRLVANMWKWAAGEELVPPSVADGCRMLEGLRRGQTTARETAPIGPVSEKDLKLTLAHLGPTIKDMVEIQRLTGCRPTEVCIMRPCDIDRTGEVWIYTPEHHKTEHLGRKRTIHVGPKAQEILRPYLLRAADAYCFSPQEVVKKVNQERHAARKSPLSCGNRPGKGLKSKPKKKPREHYSKDSYSRAIRRAAEAAGVKPWAPNRLRHLAATEIRRQFGLEACQVTLGHSKADVTQVYAERDQQLAQRVAKLIG